MTKAEWKIRPFNIYRSELYAILAENYDVLAGEMPTDPQIYAAQQAGKTPTDLAAELCTTENVSRRKKEGS